MFSARRHYYVELDRQRDAEEARKRRDRKFGQLVADRVTAFIDASSQPNSGYTQVATETEVYRTVQVFDGEREAAKLVAERKISVAYGFTTNTLHIPDGPAVEQGILGSWMIYGTQPDGSRIVGSIKHMSDHLLRWNVQARLPAPRRREQSATTTSTAVARRRTT